VAGVRLAATVILARRPFEVYLTRRSGRSVFAPDAFVFPGGTIEAQDASVQARARTLALDDERLEREFRAETHARLPSEEPPIDRDAAAALLVAALRELFEEAGVLLARGADGRPIDAGATDWGTVADERLAVRQGKLAFAAFLHAHDWYADSGALALFSHWITPPSEPRRYNTHFFFASAPAGQVPLADAIETHDGVWIAPATALARYNAGELHLVYPTIKHLARLASFDSVDAAFAYAREKRVLTIVPNEIAGGFEIPPAIEGAW